MSAPPASFPVPDAACLHSAAPLAGRCCHAFGVAIVHSGVVIDRTMFGTAVDVTFNLA